MHRLCTLPLAYSCSTRQPSSIKNETITAYHTEVAHTPKDKAPARQWDGSKPFVTTHRHVTYYVLAAVPHVPVAKPTLATTPSTGLLSMAKHRRGTARINPATRYDTVSSPQALAAVSAAAREQHRSPTALPRRVAQNRILWSW